MLFTARHRRGAYPLAPESVVPSVVKWGAAVLVAVLLLYIVGTWVLRLFGVGNPVQRMPTALTVEGRGSVNVFLADEEMQRAQDGMKLFPGERITTGSNSHATLTFFDGTVVRLDQQTDLTVGENARGAKESLLTLELQDGSIWMATPSKEAFSGAIVRTVETPTLLYSVAPRAEAVLSADSAVVFSSDGAGFMVALRDSDLEPIVLGEGQKIDLPGDRALITDLYAHREALDPMVLRSTFVEESRLQRGALIAAAQGRTNALAASVIEDVGFLQVDTPTDNQTVTTGTVSVSGKYGVEVAQIKVNDYLAVQVPESRTFSQELALPMGAGEFTIRVAALDLAGEILEETERTVKREVVLPAAPTITMPAKEGETYQTRQQELVIRGKAPANAAGIMVNDYRLQLFDPAKGEWSYLASTELANMKQGANVYDVYAIDAEGNRSGKATITIVLGEGIEGVVSSAQSSTPSTADPATLPTNDPIAPGTLAVKGPTPGSAHTATGSEFLIEGTTVPQTASVWVNDYKLQLYAPGKTFWNYIASAALNTMKPGKNVYAIVTRNAEGKILDKMEYTVTYNP
ncbi:FecR domain-containing protein [Candidatus Peregrinibacteria bacterium]|nr:FecR domain-containing protein [Candidatus Peregrinibacteria bacterium]